MGEDLGPVKPGWQLVREGLGGHGIALPDTCLDQGSQQGVGLREASLGLR